MPKVEAATTTPTIVEVAKPVPNKYGNCYTLLVETFGKVPSMATLFASKSDAYGQIALFIYPDGLKHVAVTTEMGMGYFVVHEYNYDAGQEGYRKVSFADPSLVGFTNIK